MKEIIKLDEKYFVLKLDDIKKHLSKRQRQLMFKWELDIEKNRAKEGKKRNSYVILNLDDEIDGEYLFKHLDVSLLDKIFKVSDIAVALVNAILKAKEKPR